MRTTFPPKPITTDTLRALVEQRILAAPEQRGRIERAATIVLLRDLSYRGRGLWLVESECQRGQYHAVDLERGTCTCLDYQKRQTECKHAIAVALTREATAHRPLVARISADELEGLRQMVAAPPHMVGAHPTPIRAPYRATPEDYETFFGAGA